MSARCGSRSMRRAVATRRRTTTSPSAKYRCVRQYVRTCLGSEATFVGEAAASEDAAAQIAETHPDVVLADLLLLEENGFQLAHRLRCESPGSITVLLTDAAETALPYLNHVGRANGAAQDEYLYWYAGGTRAYGGETADFFFPSADIMLVRVPVV